VSNAQRTEEFWLGKLLSLNSASGQQRFQGKAPHKPLLMLCIIDLAERGLLTELKLRRSADLVFRFRVFGAFVADRWTTRLELRMPFYHLSSQGFWTAFDEHGNRSRGRQACDHVTLDPDFFACLENAEFRLQARVLLIATYFAPDEQIALFSSLDLEHLTPDSNEVQKVLKAARDAAKRKGRCARFAVRVCSEYRFTCALTGYQCLTTDGASIVDAAHIEPWARTQNDEPTNGLALSKSAHWMFDAGLWTITDELRVLVNRNAFTEHGPEPFRLASFAGQPLKFDPAAKLRPDPRFVRAHREWVGRTG
jgi:putative restriction endonuclease